MLPCWSTKINNWKKNEIKINSNIKNTAQQYYKLNVINLNVNKNN